MSSPLRVFLLDVLISTIQSNRNLNGFSLPQNVQLKTSIYGRKRDMTILSVASLVLTYVSSDDGDAVLILQNRDDETIDMQYREK